ncbi:hypothetical protein [Chondrinema litorale]|nr:hypothetical protein [Chondrinema litorale]UZR96319.1 hypothetical protein OQ292_21920 [Chondrinema litorale]
MNYYSTEHKSNLVIIGDDVDASAPYRSTTMTSREYERFIKN